MQNPLREGQAIIGYNPNLLRNLEDHLTEGQEETFEAIYSNQAFAVKATIADVPGHSPTPVATEFTPLGQKSVWVIQKQYEAQVAPQHNRSMVAGASR